jgi:hypothetical protein
MIRACHERTPMCTGVAHIWARRPRRRRALCWGPLSGARREGDSKQNRFGAGHGAEARCCTHRVVSQPTQRSTTCRNLFPNSQFRPPSRPPCRHPCRPPSRHLRPTSPDPCATFHLLPRRGSQLEPPPPHDPSHPEAPCPPSESPLPPSLSQPGSWLDRAKDGQSQGAGWTGQV